MCQNLTFKEFEKISLGEQILLIFLIFSKARNMCKIFFIIPSKKTCHQRKLRQSKSLLFNFWTIKLTKTPILPSGHFCTSLQFIYNCSAIDSCYFCISFSHERKSERIERKFKTQNPNPSWQKWNPWKEFWQLQTKN